MINLAPEDYGFIEVSRPIQDDRGFLSQVHEFGKWVLGGNFVSSINQLTLSDPDDESMEPELISLVHRTAEPRLLVEDKRDFRLVLLHRAVRREMASRYNPGHTMGQLAADNIVHYDTTVDDDGERHRSRRQSPGLTEQLNAIAEDRGYNPDSMSLQFDRIDIVGEPGRDFILGLSPCSESGEYLMLQDQAKAAPAMLNRLSQSTRRWERTKTPSLVTAPLAKLPQDVTRLEYKRLISEINDQLLPVQLTIGSIDYSSRDRRSSGS